MWMWEKAKPKYNVIEYVSQSDYNDKKMAINFW